MRYKGNVNTMYQAEVGGERDQTAAATNEATSSSSGHKLKSQLNVIHAEQQETRWRECVETSLET